MQQLQCGDGRIAVGWTVTVPGANLVRGALAVGVVEHHVLGARQRGGGVHGGRHIQQRQLQVRRRGGRLLRVVLRHRQRLVVAAAFGLPCFGFSKDGVSKETCDVVLKTRQFDMLWLMFFSRNGLAMEQALKLT